MRTGLRSRRRKKSDDTLAGKDTFHVLDPAGLQITVTGYGPRVGLLLAQERAQRDYTDPVILTVERRSLFGPATPLYRVERNARGEVLSFTLAQED
jgi:hypothetical protein